jgi:hypothetical protein
MQDNYIHEKQFSVTWHRVAWYKCTTVSEESCASIFSVCAAATSSVVDRKRFVVPYGIVNAGMCQPVRTRVQIKRSGENPHRQKVCHMRKYLQYKTWKHLRLLEIQIRNKTSMCKQLSLTFYLSSFFTCVTTDSHRTQPNVSELSGLSREVGCVRSQYFRFDKITELLAEREGGRNMCCPTLPLSNRDVVRKLRNVQKQSCNFLFAGVISILSWLFYQTVTGIIQHYETTNR